MFRRILLGSALVVPLTIAAQAPAPAGGMGTMYAFEYFADIFGGRLIAAFDSIPAARYDYRPTRVQQSVGYIAQHLERANYGLCGQFADLKHPETAKDSLPDSIKARWPKDTLVARLKASLVFCDTALKRTISLDARNASLLLAFETDLAEHYSQISSYMRLLNMVPPSALKPIKRTAIDLPASALSQYAGVYELARGLQYDVSAHDGALFIKSSLGNPEVRLWPESQNDFFVREVDAQLTFTRDANGAVTGFVRHQFNKDRFAPKLR